MYLSHHLERSNWYVRTHVRACTGPYPSCRRQLSDRIVDAQPAFSVRALNTKRTRHPFHLGKELTPLREAAEKPYFTAGATALELASYSPCSPTFPAPPSYLPPSPPLPSPPPHLSSPALPHPLSSLPSILARPVHLPPTHLYSAHLPVYAGLAD